MALCTLAYYIHCTFRLCASVCLCISVMQKKSALNRTFSNESYRNWWKSINILKNNGLFWFAQSRQIRIVLYQIDITPNQVPALFAPTASVNVNENENAQRRIYVVNVTDPEGDAVSCSISAVSPAATIFGIWQGSNGGMYEGRVLSVLFRNRGSKLVKKVSIFYQQLSVDVNPIHRILLGMTTETLGATVPESYGIRHPLNAEELPVDLQLFITLTC